MSDTRGTAAGEGAGAPVTEMSEQQVMSGIEGLLDERPRRPRAAPPPQPRQTETPPQEAADERPAATETGSQDPAAGPDDPAPSIEEEPQPEPGEGEEPEPDHQEYELPPGWSKTDKEVFDRLPPEAQAIVTRREAEQNRAFSQKTQEVVEHRKALEATFAEIQSERTQYAQNLQQLLFVAAPEAQRFANIDWQRLASEQPAEYVRLTAERDALRGRIGGIQQELQRVQQQASQDQAQQFAVLRHGEQQRLIERLPDFGDEVKGPKLAGDIRQYLHQRGFTDQEIGQVIDHRVILVAEEAMRAARVLQARQQAEGKRNNAAPSVQPPGAGRQRSDTGAAQRRAQKMDALRRTGSQQDAINMLMEIL